MRTRLYLSLSVALALVLGAAPVLAQGAGQSAPGAAGKALKAALTKNITSGAGSIQQSFFDNLKGNLGKNLGSKAGDKAFDEFQRQNLTKNDVQKLMNGNTTTSEAKKWFGTSRKQVGKVEKSIDEAVEQKDKDCFFGILIVVMVGDFGMDPTADFCKQAAGAKETISKEEFDKLANSNVSTKSVGAIFGFGSKDDCKFMQEILNAMLSSCFVQHPMMKSMGMDKEGEYSKEDFPPLEKGMPGADMDKDAIPGGMPCDLELPPCPFMPGKFEDMLKKCGEGEDGKEGKPKPGDEEQPKPPKKPKGKKKKDQESDEEGQ